MSIGTKIARAGAVAFMTIWWGVIATVSLYVEYWLFLIEPKLALYMPLAVLVFASIGISANWTHYSHPKWKQDVAGGIICIWIFGIISLFCCGLIYSQTFRQGIFVVMVILGGIIALGLAYNWANKTLKKKPNEISS
jgi:peptidoglycan/LPS O-acetylase OafA/YrhL